MHLIYFNLIESSHLKELTLKIILQPSSMHMGLSENVVYPEKPNGFHDHYPYEKWLFHWEY